MRWLLRGLAVLYLTAAAYVGFTVMQMATPAELGTIDLLVAIATFLAFVVAVWLLLEVSHALKDLSGQ
jgi:hypothetical protein